MQGSDHREEDACLAALLSLVRTDLSRREDVPVVAAHLGGREICL